MATAEIKAVITADDRASATVSNFGNKVNKTSVGVGIAVAAMGTAALAFGNQSVKAFAESERASKQLDAVLRSTGGAAGITRDAAIDLSKSLQKLTAIDDDAILGAENMLLTFTKIGKDQFPAATKAILDTATAMNGGLKPSAEELRAQTIQLGKALQDPDAGLGALKRVGINVDELAKKFTDTMPIEEKQRLILQELGTEFAGSADATNTFSDKLAMLQVNFGNLQEKIGQVIATSLSPLLEKTNAWIEKNPVLAERIIMVSLGVGTLTVAIWGLNAAVSALSGVLGSLLGKFGIVAAAITFFWVQLKTMNDWTNRVSQGFANMTRPMRDAQDRMASASGTVAGLYGWFVNLDRAIYNSIRNFQQWIFNIPILGGALKSILPALPNLQGRAVGGPVSSGTPYIVGEKGPELFVPSGNGNIVPNDKMSTSSSNTTININVGMMTGSATEQREAAMRIFENLQDIANTKGQSVAQMIGV